MHGCGDRGEKKGRIVIQEIVKRGVKNKDGLRLWGFSEGGWMGLKKKVTEAQKKNGEREGMARGTPRPYTVKDAN